MRKICIKNIFIMLIFILNLSVINIYANSNVNTIENKDYYILENYNNLSNEEIEIEFNRLINEEIRKAINLDRNINSNKIITPYDRSYYSSETVDTSRGVSNFGYAGNQPRDGYYFPHGGSISWRDGSLPSMSVSVSVGGKHVQFGVGLAQGVTSGVVSANPNVPGPGRWKLKVAKRYEVRVVEVYKHSAGTKTLYTVLTPHVETGVDFAFEKNNIIKYKNNF